MIAPITIRCGVFITLKNKVGCRLWGRTESDMTEVTSQEQQQQRCMLKMGIKQTKHHPSLEGL